MMKQANKITNQMKTGGPRSFSVKRLALIGMFSAISIILVYLFHIPLFPAAPFLEYDMADVPIILVTFLFGPYAGFLTTVVVSVVQGLTVSAQSGFIGILMHIFATGGFALVAGNIYRRHKSLSGEIAALVFGFVTMVGTMTLWNLLLTPIFMNAPREAVLNLMLPAIIPFNIIKAGANSLIAYFVFKVIRQVMKKI